MGIGGARTSTADVLKGFAIELNGLSQEQCRSILGQVGNNWEYVEVGTSPSGSYSDSLQSGVDMTAEAGNSILRSLGNNGQETLTADKILQTCNSTINSIILGSR